MRAEGAPGISFEPHTALGGRYYYRSHFTEEAAEAQRGSVAYPRSHSDSDWRNRVLNPEPPSRDMPRALVQAAGRDQRGAWEAGAPRRLGGGSSGPGEGAAGPRSVGKCARVSCARSWGSFTKVILLVCLSGCSQIPQGLLAWMQQKCTAHVLKAGSLRSECQHCQ